MTATMVGSLKFRVTQNDGSGLDILLHEVKFVPNIYVNLFSIKNLEEWILSRQQRLINLLVEKTSFSYFYKVMTTTNGPTSSSL
jgi:hypothetical protein